MGAEDSPEALAEALASVVRRVDALEPRVHVLEIGLLRVERQLHLVFEQGQALSRQLGEMHLTLESMRELLLRLTMEERRA